MADSPDYIPGTHFEKVSKLLSRYVELTGSKTQTKKGYFCAACVYLVDIQGGKCAIVKSQGEDCNGKFSKVTAPYGYCALWAPNRSVVKKWTRPATGRGFWSS